MKWITGLFKKDKTEGVLDTNVKESKVEDSQDSEPVYGKSMTIGDDELYEATFLSNDIERKIKATEITTKNIMNRILLLQSIVSESYSLRKDEHYLKLCINFSEIYLSEFNKIPSCYLNVDRQFLTAPVFQNYATVLAEIEQFEKAIKVCEMAISYKLEDGTIGGYEGRIERIKKKIPKDTNFKKSVSKTNLKNQKEEDLKIVDNYTDGEIRQYIREVCREAKGTAKVDSGMLESSIRGALIGRNRSIEFRQIYYGAENGNSKLTEIAKRLIPKDLKWKVILETNL
jgi:hypothetical protein